MKTWKPAILRSGSVSPGSSPSISGSGLKPPGLTAWLTQLRWRRRKRIEAPRPIDDETRRSFVLGTAPGMPTKIGSRVPRSQTRSTQPSVTLGSKQIWLTMYVAKRALSNIA